MWAVFNDLTGFIPHLPGAIGVAQGVIGLAQNGQQAVDNYEDKQETVANIAMAKHTLNIAQQKIQQYYDELKMYNCPLPNFYPNGGPG